MKFSLLFRSLVGFALGSLLPALAAADKPLISSSVLDAGGQISPGEEQKYGVSANQQWLTCLTTKGEGVVDVTTGKMIKLKDRAAGTNVWAPKGNLLGIQELIEGKMTLSVFNPVDRSSRQLLAFPKKMTNYMFLTGALSWSADGTTMYATANLELPRFKEPPEWDHPPTRSTNGELQVSGPNDFYASRVWYQIQKKYPEAHAEAYRTVVLAIDVASGQFRMVCQSNDVTGIYPSPDGKWLAMVQEKAASWITDNKKTVEWQGRADIHLLPLPAFADLPTVDLEKYDDRDAGNVDYKGVRFDPTLPNVFINYYGGNNPPTLQGNGYNAQLVWAPDSSRFAWATTGRLSTGDIYIYNPATKETVNLTEKVTLSSWSKDLGYGRNYTWQFTSPKFGNPRPPLWLADSQGLIAMGHGDAWYVSLDPKVPAKNLTTDLPSETRQVIGCFGTAVTDPAGAIFVIAKDKETRMDSVWKIGVAQPSRELISDTKMALGGRSLGRAAGDSVIVAGGTSYTFANFYQLDLTKPSTPVAIGRFRKNFDDYTWPETRVLKWKTASGLVATGVLHLPIGTDATHKAAMLIEAYPGGAISRMDDFRLGGPAFIAMGEFIGAGLDLMTVLKKGIAVFHIDVPLSDSGEYAQPMQQMLEAVDSSLDAAIATGVIDADRVAIMGKDFGGYLAQAVAAKSNRFKTAISRTGWSNLPATYDMFSNLTDRPGPGFEEKTGRLAVAPWVDPVRYMENSPYFYLNQSKIPVLLLNIPGPEAAYSDRQTYRALRRLGRTAILAENYIWAEEQFRALAWLDEHLLGAQPKAQFMAIPSFFFHGDLNNADALPSAPAPATEPAAATTPASTPAPDKK